MGGVRERRPFSSEESIAAISQKSTIDQDLRVRPRVEFASLKGIGNKPVT